MWLTGRPPLIGLLTQRHGDTLPEGVLVKRILRTTVLLIICRSRVRARPPHLRLCGISGVSWTVSWTEIVCRC